MNPTAFLVTEIPYPVFGGEYIAEVIPVSVIVMIVVVVIGAIFANKTLTGRNIYAVGNSARAAKLSGINVDKMRVKGIALSTMLGALGIVVYTQGFGYLQAYTAPLQMGFVCVASVLIGGATTTKASIAHVLIGTFIYQGLIIFTPPVSNHLLAGTDISDTMRQIIQNGVILYALTQTKGGSD